MFLGDDKVWVGFALIIRGAWELARELVFFADYKVVIRSGVLPFSCRSMVRGCFGSHGFSLVA